jgi:hypothetical protein
MYNPSGRRATRGAWHDARGHLHEGFANSHSSSRTKRKIAAPRAVRRANLTRLRQQGSGLRSANRRPTARSLDRGIGPRSPSEFTPRVVLSRRRACLASLARRTEAFVGTSECTRRLLPRPAASVHEFSSGHREGTPLLLAPPVSKTCDFMAPTAHNGAECRFKDLAPPP